MKLHTWLHATLLCVATACAVNAQGQELTQFSAILDSIEAHAPKLQALKAKREAQEMEARQSTRLEDPEVEFGYFWGDPSSVGNRWDLSATQSFDFPTTYLHRHRAARQAIRNAEWQYRAERQDLLLQAQQLCIEMVYYNGTLSLARRQLALADRLMTGSAKRFEQGDITVLDYNKIQTNHQLRLNELKHLEDEREAVALELQALNGGIAVELADTTFGAEAMLPPTDFEAWWQEVSTESPMMQYVAGVVTRSQQELRTARSEWWPKFAVGYASENATETLRGFKVGVSLPVWNNRYKVRQARAELKSAEMEALDTKLAFYSRLQALYQRTLTEQQVARDLATLLQAQDTETLLTVAYDEGQLTLHEYLTELLDHFDVCRQLLGDERDYQLSLAELWAVRRFSR